MQSLTVVVCLVIVTGLQQTNAAAIKAKSGKLSDLVSSLLSLTTKGEEITTESRSLSCDAKFESVPNHSACLNPPTRSVEGVSSAESNTIVNKHNTLRSGVNPPATNMQTMSWDSEIAMVAQKWASNCQWAHDGNSQRSIPGRFSVGQNLYMDAGYSSTSWERAIQKWYDEVNDFKFGVGSTNGKAVGHYTQLVWATSNKIGCGFAKCSWGDYYVCNYGPAGNILPNQNKPYLTNDAGSSGNTGSTGSTDGSSGSTSGSSGSGDVTTPTPTGLGCTYNGVFIPDGETNVTAEGIWEKSCMCTVTKEGNYTYMSVKCSFKYIG